jgi:hypothetical protein
MGALKFDSPDRDDSPLPGVITPGTMGALKLDSPDRDDSPLPGVITPGTMSALKLDSPDRDDRTAEHWGFAVVIETSIPGVVTPGTTLSSLSGLEITTPRKSGFYSGTVPTTNATIRTWVISVRAPRTSTKSRERFNFPNHGARTHRSIPSSCLFGICT